MTIHKNKKAYIVATVFGLSLIIIVPSVSFAQNNDKNAGLLKSGVQIGLFKPHLTQSQTHFGTVISIGGSVFALESVFGNSTTTFAVNTDANTTFKKDGSADTISDLKVGQRVVVMGTTDTSSNTIAAKSVNIITHEPTQNSLKHVFKKQK